MTSYVNTNEVVRKQHWLSKIIALIAVMTIALMITVPTSMAAVSNADWWSDKLCGTDLGSYTSAKPANDALLDGSDTIMEQGGKYSVMDLYSNVISWTTWNGANVKDDKKTVIDWDADGVKDLKDTKDDVQKVADSGVHNGIGCISNHVGTVLANVFLFLSGLVVKIMSIFVTWAVNPKIICQDPANPEGACINLIKIIGGDGGSDGGIIGTLYNGLYLGLASVVFVVVAGWMLWKGIVKGQIRNAWAGLGWAFLSFVLGVMVLTNPMLLAEAPMKVSVMLGSCVIESINGRSCLATDTNSVTQSESGDANPNTLCLIDPNKDFGMEEHLAIDARMATCKMWKAFVLEPWSEGQFGAGYESLEAKDGGSWKQADLIAENPKKDKLSFWSDAYVSMKADSPNGICKGTDYKYYNIALYQLDLMSNLHDCSGSGGVTYHSSARIKTNGSVYNDWYYMIVTLASASGDKGDGKDNVSHMFTMWSGQASLTRMSLAIVAIIAAFLAAGGISLTGQKGLELTGIIGWSILAICYLFMGTILTMFAPLFMLAGIHPGTGKKMFLGWLELELEAILKYFFLILWICVVVEIYGAILGSTTNAGMMLICVLAITAALKMYEPELRNLFGNVDLGGKKLSNQIGQRFDHAMHKIGGLNDALKGGAAAGFMTAEGGLKNRFRSAADMMAYQGMQQGKRMGGFAGAAFQAADKIYDERRAKAVAKANEQNEQAQHLADSDRATSQSQIAQLNALANQGLTDDEGNVLDYNDQTEESINDLADKKKEEILNSQAVDENGNELGTKQALLDIGHDIDEQWDKKQEEDMADYVNRHQDEITVDANGVMHATDDASQISVEYARIQNQKRLNDLKMSSTTAVNEQGERIRQFGNLEDQIAYNEVQKALTDQRTIDAHNEYMQYRGQEKEEFANAVLENAKKDGRINANMTLDDVRKQGAMVQNELDNVDSQKGQSLEALKQYSVAQEAVARAETSQMQANNIKSINEEITQRAAGRMWSGKEVRRLEARSQQMDASLAAGHGLDDVEVTSISNGAARMRVLQNGAHTVASAASAVPGAVVNGSVAALNAVSGQYVENPDGTRTWQNGTAGDTARNTVNTAAAAARQTVVDAKDTVVNTAAAASAAAGEAVNNARTKVVNAATTAKNTVVDTATAATEATKDKAEELINHASGTAYLVDTETGARYEDTAANREVIRNLPTDSGRFQTEWVDGNAGTRARKVVHSAGETTKKAGQKLGHGVAAAVSETAGAFQETMNEHKKGAKLQEAMGGQADKSHNAYTFESFSEQMNPSGNGGKHSKPRPKPFSGRK